MGHQFFEKKSDIDLLIFGASLLRFGIDSQRTQSALSARLGRPATVVVAGASWAGFDMQYLLLRDLLERRHVRVVLMAVPVSQPDSRLPHVMLYRLFRFGDDPGFLDGLTLRQRASIYGETVLGGPRQALTLVRSNLVGKAEVDTRLDPEIRDGYYGAPFVEDLRNPPALPAAYAIYTPSSAKRFVFQNRPLAAYQMHFILRMAALLKEQHVRTIIFNVPRDDEEGVAEVRERLYWPDVFGPDTRMAGIPPATLFAGMSDREFDRFYVDEHLNANGKRYYTTAMPSLCLLSAPIPLPARRMSPINNSAPSQTPQDRPRRARGLCSAGFPVRRSSHADPAAARRIPDYRLSVPCVLISFRRCVRHH